MLRSGCNLVDWYRKNKRDLPWRHSRDPYAVLVSEVMLQQTQVATVLPYYQRFMQLFPTPEALARASESEAMAAWAGLGYYRRLRSLRAAAEMVSREGWPADLRTLPGVGEYTAAAVGSTAFGEQTVCADGNVRRVMSRLAGRTLSLRESAVRSMDEMGSAAASEWNQAVMELGATVCTPKAPECNRCPLAADCVACASNTQAEIPVIARASSVAVAHVCACFVRDGHVALKSPAEGEWWHGLLVFPFTSVRGDEERMAAAVRLGLESPCHLGSLRHTVTKHRIELSAFMGSGSASDVEWHRIDGLDDLPIPSPQRRVAKWLREAA